MVSGKTLTREQQIALMESAPQRLEAHARAWLDRPEFRDTLRQDARGEPALTTPPRREATR